MDRNRLRKLSHLNEVNDDPKSAIFKYMRDKVPIAAGNYGKILTLKDEMANFVEELNSKIGEKITKDELKIISDYEYRIDKMLREMSIIKTQYLELVKSMSEKEIQKQIESLKQTIKNKNDEIYNYICNCNDYKKQIQLLTEQNYQLKRDHEGCAILIKKHLLKNVKLLTTLPLHFIAQKHLSKLYQIS